MSLWMRWEWDFLPLELNCCALPEFTDWLMPNPSANHMLHVSLFLGKAVFACGKHFSAHFQHVKFDLVWFMWCCHSQLASESVLLPSILFCYTLSLRLFHSLVWARLFHSVLLEWRICFRTSWWTWLKPLLMPPPCWCWKPRTWHRWQRTRCSRTESSPPPRSARSPHHSWWPALRYVSYSLRMMKVN